jgi:hypothetical protein
MKITNIFEIRVSLWSHINPGTKFLQLSVFPRCFYKVLAPSVLRHKNGASLYQNASSYSRGMSCEERNVFEAIHVDESPVGELQLGDHRQGKEGEDHQGFLGDGAESPGDPA